MFFKLQGSSMRILIVFTVSLLLLCCTSKDQDSAETAPQTAIEISGQWISEEYFESIKNTKSPKKVQTGSEYMSIPEHSGEPITILINFHERIDSLVILRRSNTYEIWQVERNTITHRVRRIKILANDKISVDGKNFYKIDPVRKNGTPLVLEELLFQGRYISKNGTIVEFTKERNVSGLDDVEYYEPMVDYFDAGRQIDQVGLRRAGKEIEWFGFRFNGDTLNIYSLNCITYDSAEKRCLEVAYGALAFSFIKTN